VDRGVLAQRFARVDVEAVGLDGADVEMLAVQGGVGDAVEELGIGSAADEYGRAGGGQPVEDRLGAGRVAEAMPSDVEGDAGCVWVEVMFGRFP
jgi:hypothetical protein